MHFFTPLASADGMYNMVYTISTTLVGKLLLKEVINLRKGISLLLCILGCFLILYGLVSTTMQHTQKGNQDFSNTTNHNLSGEMEISWDIRSRNKTMEVQSLHNLPRHIQTKTMNGLIYGLFLCAANALCDCIGYYCSIRMKDQVDDVLIINFWYFNMSVVFSLTMALTVEWNKLTVPTKLNDIIYLTAHALTTGGGTLVWFSLISFISYLAITLLLNAEIPVKILCQYLIFPQLQPIKGSSFDFSGAIIVTIGLIIPPVAEIWKYRRDKKTRESEESESVPLTKKADE